jgi:hypothetical protein
MMSATPSVVVASESITSVVAMIASSSAPVACICLTVSSAIFDRKMSPASCTCPMANGSEEKSENIVWCTADEKSTSRTSCE